MQMHARSRPRYPRSGEALRAIPAYFLYGEPLQAPDERLIHVETIAARSKLHNWNIRPHRHRDLIQLLLLYRGHVAARLDDASLALDAPAVVVIPPGAVHSFTFQPNTSGIVISFAPGLLLELAAPESGIREFLECPTAAALAMAAVRETDLRALGDMLLREFTRSAPGRQTALRGLLGAMLANVLRLAREAAGRAPGAAAPERELVARFRRLIEERYRSHVSVCSYVTQLGVSESKLRRACLDVTGQSPIELVHLRVLVEAERQLRYTTMSIAQIAYHLGYEDPAYFTRFFTRRTKVSPRRFRARDAAAGELIR